MRLTVVFVCALAVVASAAAAEALDPADKCESSKLKVAGKYAFCRAKADSKAVKTATTPDFTKCDAKFADKWAQTESSAGAGVCPSEGDASALQAFIAQHADDVAAALAGGPLPDCPVDLATCNGDLTMCTGDLSTCSGSLGTCTTDLGTCNGDLGTCGADLTTANSNLASCSNSLSTCNANLTTTTASLTTCNSNLGTCSSDLGTCNSSLSTCSASLSSCSADLATVNAGTAGQVDVLTGKTFSSGAGVGVTGAMPNNGAVVVTPSTANQSIAAGFHDGAGFCAGDADLIAGNITSGVNIFGVTGTALPAQRFKTGQTICYNASGTVIACAGTGQDGELQKGLTSSFTDNGDGTITDNRTGLMWEKLSDDGSIHDKDTTYTWANAFATKVATLNSGTFAGYTDWRVPNVNELQGLVNYGGVSPSVHPPFSTGCVAACTVLTCSCTQTSPYWSSTTRQLLPSNAWRVSHSEGDVANIAKVGNASVRAVRGGS